MSREVIDRLKGTVHRAGFQTVLVGGTYSLLDQMTQLVTSSIIYGVLRTGKPFDAKLAHLTPA